MFNKTKSCRSRIIRRALTACAAAAIAAGATLSASAQDGRFPRERPYYENRDDYYDWDRSDRGGIRDRNYPYRRLLKDDGYYVKVIRDDPAAFGARVRYLKDDWDKKYMMWAPANFNKQALRPLVISLRGNDEEIADAFARFYNTLTQYNYAFISPEWKSGGKIMTPEELTVFIDGAIAELKEKEGLNIDPAMVILHGYERGANMAGCLAYIHPEKYILTIVDSGPFPAIAGSGDPAAGPGGALTIPSDELKIFAGRYIYLYSRYEDRAMYGKLEETRKSLVAAGARADLNYTKGLLPGAFSKTLSKSIVDMFDRAISKK